MDTSSCSGTIKSIEMIISGQRLPLEVEGENNTRKRGRDWWMRGKAWTAVGAQVDGKAGRWE